MDAESSEFSLAQVVGQYSLLCRPVEGSRIKLYPDGRASREYYTDLGGRWVLYGFGTFAVEGQVVQFTLKPTAEFGDYFDDVLPSEFNERLHIRQLGKRILLVPEKIVVEFDAWPHGTKYDLYRRTGNLNDK